MTHLDDILPDLLLGTLEPNARQAAERHLATCEACRAEVARLSPAVEALTTLAVPALPPPQVLERVVAAMESPGRFARFAEKVAALLDITRERALAVLESLSDAAAWLPGPTEAIQLLPVETGPAKAGMLAAFVRVPPGVRFPRHTHHGREWNLVLEGGFREDSGHEVWPGELLEKDEGSAHDFTALEGPACIAAAVIDGITSFEELEA
ncbi:cupin domain-containing protein [Hyalangium rubrum]|uniref:Cupin domain-containing protein n=1 Tax=Hyalangium rubrum TaxID=3103134 RepID=A0ABU5H2W7_9BACT|nr:cupin domain-containing protein [Hyalangium sp. s54d21]MDY7227813.1 cupin domain-containing protein [Hyalangium sp. s54d21]